MPQQRYIEIQGARVNNLKNISVQIPENAFTVITGLSGSGKSSLAFDTLYAEGQRRYVESLSAYARQFLPALNLGGCILPTGARSEEYAVQFQYNRLLLLPDYLPNRCLYAARSAEQRLVLPIREVI
jgi:ABC-type glutathione transport system ATPase component